MHWRVGRCRCISCHVASSMEESIYCTRLFGAVRQGTPLSTATGPSTARLCVHPGGNEVVKSANLDAYRSPSPSLIIHPAFSFSSLPYIPHPHTRGNRFAGREDLHTISNFIHADLDKHPPPPGAFMQVHAKLTGPVLQRYAEAVVTD